MAKRAKNDLQRAPHDLRVLDRQGSDCKAWCYVDRPDMWIGVEVDGKLVVLEVPRKVLKLWAETHS